MLDPGKCGDDCNYCPRYLATQSGDKKRLEAVAAMWQMIGWWDALSPEDLICDGCAAVSNCGLVIKECVLEKSIENCGKCPDYPCEKLTAIFENNEKEIPICRKNLSTKDFQLFNKAFFSKKERLDSIHNAHFYKQDHVAIIDTASTDDAEEILALQKLAYISEAEIYNDYTIQPLTQTLAEIKADFAQEIFLKATINKMIVGSVRGQMEQGTCHIGRLIVHPDFQNRGIGTRLMEEIEKRFHDAKRYVLFTGHRSERNLRLYSRLGYKPYESVPVNDNLTMVYLEKAKGWQEVGG